jgi:phosphate starvation-inducible protein PhoH and related proteins
MATDQDPIITKALDMEDVDLRQLFGPFDSHRKDLEKVYAVSLVSRRGQLLIRGVASQIDSATEEILARISETAEPPASDGTTPTKPAHPGHPPTGSASGDIILHTNNRTPVSPRSKGQRTYVDAITAHDITFGIGPAGTGKTYLAVATAVAALKRRQVTRIIVTRPAVEAGENLGFLPGDLKEKVDPYLRPLYDALYEMITPDKLKQYLETHVIEIVPLAFMRGRTLNNAFVILDEAQNTTTRQMKMFLTRLGADSKAVITGDVTQVDLPTTTRSGLGDAQVALKDINGIAFVELNERDVVRHRLVQHVIRAYDRHENDIDDHESTEHSANSQDV